MINSVCINKRVKLGEKSWRNQIFLKDWINGWEEVWLSKNRYIIWTILTEKNVLNLLGGYMIAYSYLVYLLQN